MREILEARGKIESLPNGAPIVLELGGSLLGNTSRYGRPSEGKWLLTIGWGNGNTPYSKEERVVSMLHELLHVMDNISPHTRLEQLYLNTNNRHAEIYQLQNQTLYDLTGRTDKAFNVGGNMLPVNKPDLYIGDKY